MAPKSKAKSRIENAGNGDDELERPPQRPDWPSLKPLVDPLDLELQTILPNQILLIPNFFTSALCKTYINFLTTLPLTTTPNKPQRGEAVRVNDRFQTHDPEFAERLWRQTSLRNLVNGFDGEGVNDDDDEDAKDGNNRGGGLLKNLWDGDDVEEAQEEMIDNDVDVDETEKELLREGKKVLGLSPNIRIYRYRPGQFFDKHYDESNKLDFVVAGSKATVVDKQQQQQQQRHSSSTSLSIPAKTTWTLLIYLSTCQGGETVFYAPDRNPSTNSLSFDTTANNTPSFPIVIPSLAGTALLHRHGDQCLLHEGREVKPGSAEKWIIRSDLVVRRRKQEQKEKPTARKNGKKPKGKR